MKNLYKYKSTSFIKTFASSVAISGFLLASTTQAAPAPREVKDWTFMVFLNGNNNLDRFGLDDINEMEQVGSTENVNVVVQWASYSRRSVQRLYVEKDADRSRVTSPIIEDMGSVDMGDINNLVDFMKWAHENYPARHYFIDVWNHGNGWHINQSPFTQWAINPTDISYDDLTGNSITTEELGRGLQEVSDFIGRKIDIYGSDACLMAMIEVAAEMKNAVAYSVGSEDLEPGPGWHYGDFFRGWQELGANSAPADVARTLTRTYKASYQGGSQGRQEVTLSAVDLSKIDVLNSAIGIFAGELVQLARNDRAGIREAVRNSLYFYSPDYVDLKDLLTNLETQNVSVSSGALEGIRNALGSFVIANEVTDKFREAGGISMWIPTSTYYYNRYKDRYQTLAFNRATRWNTLLQLIVR